jgi:hypothetical protein
MMLFRKMSLWLIATFVVAEVSAARATVRTPTFSRQTGLACSACHTQFPELTEMGRSFKLNGYTMQGQNTIEDKGLDGEQNLLVSLVAPLSVALRTSYSATGKAQPGKANGTAVVPDMLSIFTGGAVTPNVGVFLEVGFDPDAGTFGVQMLDVRYAARGTLFSKPTTFGLTLNNMPTVQDIWNSTPSWGFPFGASGVAPTPTASPMLVSGMGVVGLTGFAHWNNSVYGEFGLYHAAQLGVGHPLDSTAMGVVKGVAPYWRLALTHQIGSSNLMLGAYGLSSGIYPMGVSGPTNRFTDVAVDAQYQVQLGRNSLSAHGTWIHESQSWDAGGAANAKNTLNSVRLDAMYRIGQRFGFALAPFAVSGTTDATLYAPNPVDGSRTGEPNSQGLIGELDVNPWENLRVQLQYVMYSKFNGAVTDYDGSGRKASDNNTVYLAIWIVY